jgi:HK97 family phage prohead protease
MRYSTLDVKFEVKELFGEDASPEQMGTFTGLASVYNVTDLHGDIVLPGAFTKTVAERGGRVKLLYQHDPLAPIGIAELSDSEAGLFVKGRLSLGTEKGREAYVLMRDGVLDSMSIGYESVKAKREEGVRKLSEIKLFEVSLVTFPANVLASVQSVKALKALNELPLEERLAEFADMAAQATEEIKSGRVSAQQLTLLRDVVGALLGALAPASTPDGTPAEGAAEASVEPELLHSLGGLFTEAVELAATR